MKTSQSKNKVLSALRRKAEKKLAREQVDASDLPAEDLQRLLHELRTHQIELEMQNEELLHAQGELEESRLRYRELYDNAPLGYLTLDKDGNIKEINLRGASMMGPHRRTLVGRSFASFVKFSYRDVFRSHCREVLESDFPVKCELILKKENDGQFYARLESTRHEDSKGDLFCQTIISDISESKRAEQVLAEREVFFRLVTEKSADVISIVDAKGTISYQSPSSEHILGYKPQEVIGTNSFDLIHPDDRERALAKFRQAVQNPRMTISDEFRIRHKDGSWRYIEATGRNLLSEPVISGIMINSRDITERKVAEIELGNMSEELKRYNADLEQFASAASHDLREPLRTIGFFLSLLEKRYKGRLDDKADEFIFFTQDSVKRMDRLIKELVDFSRLRTGGTTFKPVNFAGPLEGALTDLHSAINESGAEITFDALPTIEADELQITRLFQNLISNSIKFRGKEKPRIHISAVKKDDEWVFSVRDNSIGIEPKFFQRIFQVFQRLHTTLEYEGTGMGLTMSKKIVELHKGKIWVESEPGKGATFFFSIPEHHS